MSRSISCVPSFSLPWLKAARWLGAASLLLGSALPAWAQTGPAAFSFIQRSNVTTNAVITSESKTLSGFSQPLPVSISGGNGAQYKIGSGAYTSGPGSIASGQTLSLRHTSAVSANSATSTTVTVGDYSTAFTSTTGASDRTPEAFDFGSRSNVFPNSFAVSAPLTLSGYNTAIAIVAGPNAQYSIDGGAWSNASASLQPGQSLTMRHLTSSQPLAYTKTYLTVGGITGYFSTRNRSASNQSPVARAGVDQIVDENSRIRLDGSASSDAESALGYAWSQVSGPAVTLTGASTATPEFTAPAVSGDQLLVFRLSVSDDLGATASDEIQVNVLDTRVVSIADAMLTEGSSGLSSMSFSLSLSAPAVKPITLSYQTQDATAVSPADYAPLNSSLSFAAGESQKTISVAITGDSFDENDERFTIGLSNAQGAVIGTGLATGTITDDDSSNLLRIGAAKRSITPAQAHIDGVAEARVLGGASHVQKFNLGGFGINPLQNTPDDPFGGVQQGNAALTEPAGQRVFTNSQGRVENTQVRAFAIEQAGGDTVLFVMIDAVGAGNVIQKGLKNAVIAAAAAQGVSLKFENILFGQSHSHAGADLQGLWGGVPQAWINGVLYPAAAAAAAEALASRQPAHLSFRQGQTVEFNNYRRPRVDPKSEADGTMTLLSAVADDGTPVGSILQYNAHPTGIGDGTNPRTPHGDYIQGATEWLESQATGLGGTALYYNGPIADASGSGSRAGCAPVAADQPYSGVRCKGEGMADYLMHPANVLNGHELNPTVRARAVEVVLPVTNPGFLAFGLTGSFNRYYDFAELPVSQIPGLGAAMTDLPQLTPVAKTWVSRVTLGGAEGGLEIVTIPGEATNTFGNYIRSLAKTQVMLLGLTHNSFGYILPEDEFSYVDQTGDAGLVLPFTGYEEVVSLGPLTAPLLRSEGYNRLFDVDPTTGDTRDLPPSLRACLDGVDHPACVLQMIENRFDLFFSQYLAPGVQTLAAACHANAPGPLQGVCGLLDALQETNTAVLDDSQGAISLALNTVYDAISETLNQLANSLGTALGIRLPVPGADPAPALPPAQPLLAGVAKKAIQVPVGTPLGGYLRPPVGGDYLPGAEAFAEGDPNVFINELADFIPSQADGCDAEHPESCPPLAPIPDELRKLTSPYATYSPPSRGYYDSLIAKAVALYDGNDYVVLVKTDFIGMLNELVEDVKADVKTRKGIDLGDGLIMSATHTHDGPGAVANHSARYFWLAMDMYQHDVYRRVVSQLADVVVAALDDLKPARIGHGNGIEAEGLNGYRRDRYARYADDDENDGDGLSDADELRRRIGVIRIDDAATGEPRAVVINWAAHGIAFDVENQYFSGDVLASVERETEQLMRVPVAMLIQNSGGDISPRGVSNDNKLQRIESYGKRMAPQVAAVSQGISSFETAPDLRSVSQRIILNRERLGYKQDEYPYPWGGGQCGNDIAAPFADVGVKDIPGYQDSGLPVKNPFCLPSPPPDAADLADNGVAENGSFYPQDTILTAAKIGAITLMVQPGEPLTEYGVRLMGMAKSEGYKPADTFVWGYSGDHIGYILPPEEDDWANFGGAESTTTFWGWKQGARFIDVSRDLVKALRDGKAAPADEFQANYALYRDKYELTPAAPVTPSLLPGTVVEQPGNIARFDTTRFVFEGGDPVLDFPSVLMQKLDPALGWQPVRRANGEVLDSFFEMHLKYRLVSGRHLWTAEFEAPKDWATGSYRFKVSGKARQAAVAPYALESAAFAVTAANSLTTSAVQCTAGVCAVNLQYRPLPGNYRVIDARVPANQAAPVRGGTVVFSNGSVTVTAGDADGDGRYSASIEGTVSASGSDTYGNSTPTSGGPAPDQDGDGVPDASDQCPTQPGTAGNNGCPAETGSGFPLCDPTPFAVGCLSDLDQYGLPGSSLQGLVDTAYNTLTGTGSSDPNLPGLFLVGTGSANHDPKSRVCFGSGSMCSRSADPSTEPDAIRDHLISRATAITGVNGETFIVITTTNIGYFLAYKAEQSGLNGIYDVRLRIAKLTGVPSTNITVVSDHSHNGPDTIGIWGGVSADYMKITADAVVKAAVQAYGSRRAARIKVAAVNQNDTPVAGVPRLDSSYEVAPGLDLAHGNPTNDFRLLVADDANSGARILTMVNYAPHATVTNGDKFDGKYRLTGDWTAWAPQEAEAMYGGMGLAAVGALGSTDWNKTGGIEQREAEARSRLRTLMTTATAQLQPVLGAAVKVESTFIRELMTQPVLLLNYKPGVDHNDARLPSNGKDVRIDRSVLPPFLTGKVVGTYVSAIRIGDVFISTFPGEPFGEMDYAIRNEGRVQGTRAQFLLGGANDFFGYMVKKPETYEQTARTGALYLGGCPEQELYQQAGLEHEQACSDHWSLMVSPTIGSHIVCTLQNAADRLGFTTANRDAECPVLTALDGLAGPPESDSPLAYPLLDARNSAVQQARELAEQCRGTAAPTELCDALSSGADSAEVYLGSEPVANTVPDGDGDGVADADDQCPTESGPASNNGCPLPPPADEDGDGVADASDDCPGTPSGQAVDAQGCPLPPASPGFPICEPFSGDNYCVSDIPVLGSMLQELIDLIYNALTGGGSEPPADQGQAEGLAGCLLSQDPALCQAAVEGLSGLTDCPPDESGLNCAFNVAYRSIGIGSAAEAISGLFASCDASPAAPACAAIRSSGNGALPDRLAVASESLRRGDLIYTAAAAAAPSAKTVDGDPADWMGASTRIGGSDIYEYGEHIYTDYLFDAYGADNGDDARRLVVLAALGQLNSRSERVDALQQAAGDQLGVPQPAGSKSDHYGDASNREDGTDLTEVRWSADPRDLFFLARVAKLEAAGTLKLLILADTEAGSGMQGLDAGLSTGKFDRALLLREGGGQLVNLITGATTDLALSGAAVAVNAGGYANALEARIPRALLERADGKLRVAVMTVRQNGNRYTPANLAYRYDEPVSIYSEHAQALALFAGNVDAFTQQIAVAELLGGRSQSARPGPGYHERQFISGANISVESDAENGRLQPYGLFVPSAPAVNLLNQTRLSFWLHYRGGKAHSGGAWTPRLIHQLGEEQGNIVVTPRGRGTSTWYTTRSHQDFFEVFADIAGTGLLRQYASENLPAGHGFTSQGLFSIDPARVYLSGYSMGGYATYLFGGLYPDLFAAGYSTSGAVTQGAWTGIGPEPGAPGYELCGYVAPDETPEVGGGSPCFIEANSGRANAQLNYRILDNTRHLPLVIHHGSNDELALTPGAVRMGQRLLELGYRYDATTFLGYEHFTQAIMDEWADGAHYLNRHTRPENPRTVTYKVVPALVKAINEVQLNGLNGGQPFQFHPDGAYWVDDLVVRTGANGASPSTFGQIDAESQALGARNVQAVPRTGSDADTANPSASYVSTPLYSPGHHSTPYVRHALDWQELPGEMNRTNRFTATLKNLSAASLDLGRMGLSFTAAIDGSLNSDGAAQLQLTHAGSEMTVCVAGVATGSVAAGGSTRISLASGTTSIRLLPGIGGDCAASPPVAAPVVTGAALFAHCRASAPDPAVCTQFESQLQPLVAACTSNGGAVGTMLGGAYSQAQASAFCRGVLLGDLDALNQLCTASASSLPAACVPVQALAGLLATRNPWLARRPLNISHRGGAEEFPENTLFAYAKSLAVGSGMIEADVYQTSDGELVVIHDDTVNRTTNGSGSVSGFTLAQLKALDAAYCFRPGGSNCGAGTSFPYRGMATGALPPPEGYSANDFRIPTLRELLSRFPNTLINLELKPDPKGTGSYEGKLAALLAEFGRRDDVIVASFLDTASAVFKAQAPLVSTSVPTGQVAVSVASGQGPGPGLSAGHAAFQVPIAFSGVPVIDQNFIDDAHARGLAVQAWTINSCTEMVDLLDMGVDGIMSDRPSLLQSVLDARLATADRSLWPCTGTAP